MSALEAIKAVKQMRFFEDKRDLVEFIADWEYGLWGEVYECVNIESRAYNLCERFYALGWLDKKVIDGQAEYSLYQ